MGKTKNEKLKDYKYTMITFIFFTIIFTMMGVIVSLSNYEELGILALILYMIAHFFLFAVFEFVSVYSNVKPIKAVLLNAFIIIFLEMSQYYFYTKNFESYLIIICLDMFLSTLGTLYVMIVFLKIKDKED